MSGGINPTYIGQYASGITHVINGILVPVIFTLCILVLLFGVAKAYIFSGGSDTARSEGHKLILWGIIGLAVMLSVWGLVNILLSTFSLSSGGTPPTLPQLPTGSGTTGAGASNGSGYYQVNPTGGQ